MVRVVGKWFFKHGYSYNSVPEYRFAKVVKRIGEPYYDDVKYWCQKVEVELYNYKVVGCTTKSYKSDTTYYLPVKKIRCEIGTFRISPSGKTVVLGLKSYTDKKNGHIEEFHKEILDLWDGKKPASVVRRY